jgi:small subunit ribosomal protein S16
MYSLHRVDENITLRYDHPCPSDGRTPCSLSGGALLSNESIPMITIRLARYGRKNRPSFRIVVQEKQRAPSSVVLETLGHYHPISKPAEFVVKSERIAHWLQKGAHVSNTLHNLLIEHKVIDGEKRRVTRAKKEEKPEAPPAHTAGPAPKAEGTADQQPPDE